MDALRDWMIREYPLQGAESPMESLLWAGWQMVKDRTRLTPAANLVAESQVTMGNYRADFLFCINNKQGQRLRLVVEVDGHEFHERTKEQAARDKARDRWMTGQGYQVMRFTGSEVYANPFKVGTEIADHLFQLHYGTDRKHARALAGLEALRALIEGTP